MPCKSKICSSPPSPKRTKQSLNCDWHLENTGLALFNGTINMTSYLSDSFPSVLVWGFVAGKRHREPGNSYKENI